MENLIDNHMENAIKCAFKIESLNISDEYKRNYYIDCIKKESIYTNNIDLITLFYGRYGYDKVSSANDILKYVYISKCLRKIYDRASVKKSASNTAIPWAINSSEMNDKLYDFFRWLGNNNGSVNIDDTKYLKSFYELINDNKIDCPMKPRFLNMDLISIIEGISLGTITVSNTGGLA